MSGLGVLEATLTRAADTSSARSTTHAAQAPLAHPPKEFTFWQPAAGY